MARTVTCACGHELSAADDGELLTELRQHLAGDHPDLDVPDEQLRAQIQAEARDAVG